VGDEHASHTNGYRVKLKTSFTISLDYPRSNGNGGKGCPKLPILKLKLGGDEGDLGQSRPFAKQRQGAAYWLMLTSPDADHFQHIVPFRPNSV